MKVALVFNPFSHKIHEENLPAVMKYFGMFPPLSLAWVAAIVEKAGHEAVIVDARTLRLSRAETAALLKDYRPDVIGTMMTTFMFPETLSWLAYLRKELLDAGQSPRTLVGGANLRLYPEASLSHPEIDFGCIRHAYYTVPALLDELESGRNDFARVPGLAWKKNGNVVLNPHPQKIDFNAFPNPARHLLPNDLYAEFTTQRKNFTVMVTSLGCPFSCAFCDAGQEVYSPRTPETVVNEMQECRTKYDIREIDFFDYEFTARKERVRDICGRIAEKKLDVTWACRSRVDTVDEDLLRRMYGAGCRRIYWGIEHWDQHVLDGFRKGITVERVRETMRMSRRIGIQNLGFFLAGAPGDTKERIERNVRFAEQLDLDYVQFSKLLAKPGTALWRDMRKGGGPDYWENWVRGSETDRDIPRPWLTALTNDELDRLTHRAYAAYHSRIPFLVRHALKCRSLTEFFRKVLAYFSLLSGKGNARPGGVFRAYSENIVKVALRKHAFLKDLSLRTRNRSVTAKTG